MVIAVLASEENKKKLSGIEMGGHVIVWADSLRSLCMIEADLYMDLLFTEDAERMSALKRIFPKPLMVYPAPGSRMPGSSFIPIRALPGKDNDNRFVIVAGEAEITPWKAIVDELKNWFRFEKGISEVKTPRLILSIDTALNTASVGLARDNELIALRRNDRQADHAAWMHPAIREMMKEVAARMEDLDAIAVTAGPGSYTGLRVGMAAAKGLCYALDIPLITESTLRLTAYSVRREVSEETRMSPLPLLICPMIDARRMEVFTALYTMELQEKLEPCAMVLEPDTWTGFLSTNRIVFCGNGSKKWKTICTHSNASFSDRSYTIQDIAEMAWYKYEKADFTGLVYAEPAYIKDVFINKTGD